jgi:hypothetical protein
MSNRSQAAQRLREGHHSTLHAFFLAAKESGYTEFELQLVTSPKGRIEFCISPREHSEMSATFDVRGNTVRVAVSDVSVVPVDDADVRISYGGTRSGEGSTGRTVLTFTPPSYGNVPRPTEDGLEPLGLGLRPRDPIGNHTASMWRPWCSSRQGS